LIHTHLSQPGHFTARPTPRLRLVDGGQNLQGILPL
jgi:hypothetical protein